MDERLLELWDRYLWGPRHMRVNCGAPEPPDLAALRGGWCGVFNMERGKNVHLFISGLYEI